MTLSTDGSRGSMDSLCDVVMQTIKELSAARQPISPASLRQALSQRQEIVSLFHESGRTGIVQPESGEAGDDSASGIQERMRLLDAQRKRLASQLDELEAQNGRIREFNKRALTSFIGLCRAHDNKELNKSLERFKKLLLEDADPKALDRGLQEIKDIVLNEETGGSRPVRSEPSGIWGRLTRRKGDQEAAATACDLNFEKLKEAYLEVFAEFHSDLGKEYLDSFGRIQESIRGSGDIERLLSHTGEIVHLIQTYTRLINEERTQVLSVFTEIGSNLAEMESHFMASVDRSSQAQESSSRFDRALEGQLQEINDSAQFSKSLEEFKGLVFDKLSAIKSALEKKRQEDNMRSEEISREVEGLQKSLQTLKDEVVQAQEKAKVLEKETLMDPLTGIHNRRAYERRIVSELDRYHRYQHVFSVLLFDLDDFKKVNDQYGHHAGDRCLKEIIKRIKPALRDLDFLARYGGEEFIVILPGTGQEAAYNVAERLRHLIEKTRFLYQGETIPITISVGVSEAKPADQTLEALFTRVDGAVYEAKRAGRNRVVQV